MSDAKLRSLINDIKNVKREMVSLREQKKDLETKLYCINIEYLKLEEKFEKMKRDLDIAISE